MCGIVGSMGILTGRGARVVEDLRIVNATRGLNGCGVAYINAQQHIHVIKGMVTPQALCADKKYQKAIKRVNIACIAHSRAATVGSLTAEFAHPFKFKNVTGVHNGTIFEHGRKYLHKNEEYESDSENIMASIDKWGIRKAWSHIDGAAALAFWDKREKALCLIRNAQRPLFFAFLDQEGEVDEGAAMVYASEPWMISGCCDRNNVKHSTIWNPPADALFVFKYSMKKSLVTYDTEMLKPFKWVDHNEVKPYTPPPPFVKRPVNEHTVLSAKNAHERTLEEWTDDDLGDYGWWNGNFGRKPPGSALMPLIDAIKVKTMDEDAFYQAYHYCIQCAGSLLGHYKEAVVIDDKCAMCPTCANKGLQSTPVRQPLWRQ